MKKLDKKLCVVTGAASGIGAAIVKAFCDEGATVIATDKDTVRGQSTADSLSCEFVELDISKETHWNKFAERFPRIDVLVNNAGETGLESDLGPHDPEHASLEAWRAVHATNLDGTFLGCRYAIGAMREMGEGSIINISSRSGLVGIPGVAAYASSKAGVRNHTKTVAIYCAQTGMKVRCNSIHPAAILTPMMDPIIGTGPDREKNMVDYVKDTPLKRWGQPSEVAALTVLLASDDAPYITGSEFTIDGGILAGSPATPTVE